MRLLEEGVIRYFISSFHSKLSYNILVIFPRKPYYLVTNSNMPTHLNWQSSLNSHRTSSIIIDFVRFRSYTRKVTYNPFLHRTLCHLAGHGGSLLYKHQNILPNIFLILVLHFIHHI